GSASASACSSPSTSFSASSTSCLCGVTPSPTGRCRRESYLRRRRTDGPPDPLVRPHSRPLEPLLPARGIGLRRRHAAPVPPPQGERARRHVRVDRARLGRQRSLARRRRRRDLRCLPRLVRDDVLRVLPRPAPRPLLPHDPRRLVR